VATVSITVIALNQAPVAVNDSYTTNEDVVLNVAAPGVLANDTDANGNPLTAAVVTGPTKGTLTLNANGSFTYTPNANTNGSDSFTYRANDGTANSNTATVTLTVNAVNDPPVVVNDALSVLQGSAATTVSVLANDSNVEAGETLTITAVTQGANGTVAINTGSTSVRYTPTSTYTGPDSFTYTVVDGNGGSSTGTVNVTVQPKPTITINDADIVEGNSGTKDATVTVSLSHAVVAPVTVKYATANGVARSGSDYIAASGTLTFAAGETSKPVVVKIIGETTKERDETFAVTLSLPTNATIARTNGFITIIDDDSTPTATLSGSKTSEGGSSAVTGGTTQMAAMSLMSAGLADSATLDSPSTKMAVFTITLTNASEIPIQVDYRTVDGTGVAGDDYTAVFGTLTFAEDETVKTIEVPIRPDIKHELDEALSIELSNPVELMLENAAASSVILDDDPAPFIDVTDVSVIEGTDGVSQAVFTVTLASESGKAESVRYSTSNGTAAAGSDYTAVSGEIPFAAGVTVQRVVVPVAADREPEGDETFFLNLVQASDSPLAKAQAVATIVNDDTAARPTLSIGDAAPVAEGNSGTANAQFIVALSSPATGMVTVSYATADSTAVAGTDYTASAGTLTFAVGEQFKTVVVPVIGDVLEEKGEVFFLNLGSAAGATVLDGQGIGTILNDDAAAWTTSTVADFAGGTVDSGAFVLASPESDGSLTLTPSVRAEFTGTALPAAWSGTLKKGGVARVAGDVLTIDFATVNNTTIYTAGKAIEFVATFSGAVNQLAGFTSAQFIVKTDGALYARSTSSPVSETKVDGFVFNQPHRFRIIWTAGRMRYEVDGTQVADHVWGSLPTQMPLQFADLTAVGGGSLVIDWVRATPYAAAGTFTSKVYDAGESVAWMSANATATMPAGTDVIVTMRSGNTATPDGTWTAFAKADGSAAGRYAQYRIELKTTAPAATPAVEKLVVTYERR
jgi:VCBS repeat-containing protein